MKIEVEFSDEWGARIEALVKYLGMINVETYVKDLIMADIAWRKATLAEIKNGQDPRSVLG